MSLILCGHCKSVFSRESRFCSNCKAELKDLLDPRFVFEAPFPILRLFRYRGIVRDLIHQSKIHNDPVALAAIVTEALEVPEVWSILRWTHEVAAVPASPWSRLRGRYDIASWMTKAMVLHLGKESITPIRRAQFFNKRVFSRDGTQGFINLRSGAVISARKSRILLVDDVVTTGKTMARLSTFIGSSHVRGLALASPL